MKFNFYLFLMTMIGVTIFSSFFEAGAFGVTLTIAIWLILKPTESIMFREWALFLYAFNYLLAPAITYQLESEKIVYAMKLASDDYFSLALPGFVFLASGMYLIPTRIFKPDFKEISRATVLNEQFLVQLTLFGVICDFLADSLSSEFAFFIYLLSLLRFVSVFALYASNPIKYKWLIILVLGFEIYSGFRNALFHDAIMWVIFFCLFYLYLNKPTLGSRILGMVTLILFVLLIQAFKSEYRERVWFGEDAATFGTITDVGIGKANYDDLTGEENLLGTLNRGNQAWIFASTVENMERTRDFQGMNNVNLYLEAALLPRFLAPNKITSGNRFIFNKFSGHQISEGTSMGLGVFADGYIAYGKFGVYVFTFVLGVLFSLTFKLVEFWSKLSPFFILLILPILNYAVRPDCELQTTINHLVKSVFVFGFLVSLSKYKFVGTQYFSKGSFLS